MRLLLLLALAFAAVDAQADGLAPPAVIAADTLRYTLAPGEALVAALPGETETTYRVVRAPALSWIVGRSFFWQTVPAERGREYVILERQRADGRTEQLVLIVDVGTG